MDDDTIRTLLSRLSRPHPSGGKVVERAALLAEGVDFSEVLAWITAHAGEPEAPRAAAGHGLHGSRLDTRGGGAAIVPLRFVLPADALARAAPAGTVDAGPQPA